MDEINEVLDILIEHSSEIVSWNFENLTLDQRNYLSDLLIPNN